MSSEDERHASTKRSAVALTASGSLGNACLLQPLDFPELRAAIETGIEELGGCVAPKFSWSSPHDATWVTASHSLACSTADEASALSHTGQIKSVVTPVVALADIQSGAHYRVPAGCLPGHCRPAALAMRYALSAWKATQW